MSAYYNEIDPFCVEWLRNLIKAGHIADGVVDNRSIVDVSPSDLKGFSQCHFFAGVGVWSYALRNAGWTDDRQVWTGSCPCQPFSAAGVGKGFDDKRHLWPVFDNLISQCSPSVVFGEQVASSDGLTWIDLVQSDLESKNYAFASSDICAASVGAPHIRQRLYFVANRMADTNVREFCTQPGSLGVASGKEVDDRSNLALPGQPRRTSDDVRSVANTDNTDNTGSQGGLSGRSDTQRGMVNGHAGCDSTVNRLADTNSEQWDGTWQLRSRGWEQSTNIGSVNRLADTHGGDTCAERQQRSGEQRQQPQDDGCLQSRLPNPTNGFWRDVDWLGCRDGKFRPVKPGSSPLADGTTSRVGRLRAYGNAINAEQAKVFIEAAMYGLSGLDLT